MKLSDEKKHPHFLVKTLGCKANLSDSQFIEAEMIKRGLVPYSEKQSISNEQVGYCVINSCTVTDEADRQSRKMASRLSRDFPNAKIVITGCSVEVDPEKIAHSKGVHYVVGNQDKPRLVDLILKAEANDQSEKILGKVSEYKEMLSKHPMDREWPLPQGDSVDLASDGLSTRTRAFLKIQDGCNSFCTYCVIPYGRGPSRSLSISEVVKQIADLVLQGYREVVLTGINIGDYGIDWSGQFQLETLVKAILDQTGLERLRISSLDPTEITPGLLGLMESEDRLCPHFHVSLQSPHSKILRLMKRKYSWEHVEQKLGQIEKLSQRLMERGVSGGVFVGMDLITGFPGETDEDFQWTIDALERLFWTRLHVFPYSERSKTPATRLPHSVPKSVRMDRARRLREMSLQRMKERMHQKLDQIGTVKGVLLEGHVRGPDGSKDWLSGYSSSYQRFLVPAKANWTNHVVSLKPQAVFEDVESGDISYVSEIQ